MSDTRLRSIDDIIPSVATSDGAGVSLRRSIGSRRGLYLDPFLMLDEFFSDNPNDYIAGFPSHPHRGFETVTYMLDGHMRHEDHLGNRGDLGPGDVQWMTAGRGIIHSEMPQQTAGRLRGFQLWINLPAREKMVAPGYQDIASDRIPVLAAGAGVQVKVIAGSFAGVQGAVSREGRPLSTDPLYLDVQLAPNAQVSIPVALGHHAFVYAYDGTTAITAADGAERMLPHRAAGILSDGDAVHLRGGDHGARVLLLAARPLNEPVVQYGPFVMNTREEIEQTLDDYRHGRLTEAIAS